MRRKWSRIDTEKGRIELMEGGEMEGKEGWIVYIGITFEFADWYFCQCFKAHLQCFTLFQVHCFSTNALRIAFIL